VKPLTAAIYARVSTKDKGQDTENQLAQLRKYASAQGWTAIEYIDHEHGNIAEREKFLAMFEAAARREIDLVLTWALDRFTREGVAETFIYISRLTNYGVKYESLTEPHFRTTGPAGELMIAIAAWIAKQERIRISERTKAGLATARAKGKVLGRPRKVFRRDLAEQMRLEGKSWRAIARELGIPFSTVRKSLTERKPGEKPRKQGVQKSPSPAAKKVLQTKH
jgi:DNA invertase Pin-like site-specific DNA recombinase